MHVLRMLRSRYSLAKAPRPQGIASAGNAAAGQSLKSEQQELDMRTSIFVHGSRFQVSSLLGLRSTSALGA